MWGRRLCQAHRTDVSRRCLSAALVKPHHASIQQLGEDDGLVDVTQRVVAHAVRAQQFQSVHRLCAVADDVADVLASGQMVPHVVTPSILMEVM